MFDRDRRRWDALKRPTPEWFRDTPFGIFIHWGAYSVAAWAEPTGELGTVDDDTQWYTHNPYSEWYYNTIRIGGSPAQDHHREAFGAADYDVLLDLWRAERFDAEALMDLVAGAGADYVVPTTKHHDGITLWDAPGTGTRNTVHRGPRRDLVGEIGVAARKRGIRFGVYYSGGLDWHVRPMPPHLTHASVQDTGRPKDAEYARYAEAQVRDLVDRYNPVVLWNDIEWPDDGKHFGEDGLGTLFEHFYTVCPDGVVNDRWGRTHHDYSTSEYQHSLSSESEDEWENCRGIGLSFGYNQVEGPEHSLDGAGIARHLADVVSRGGRLLLNIGPRADGTLPELQARALTRMGEWMQIAKPTLVGAAPAELTPTADSDAGWVRAITSGRSVTCFVDRLDGTAGTVVVAGLGEGIAESLSPEWGTATAGTDGTVVVELADGRPGPAVIRFTRSRPSCTHSA